ncbi:hypothetical protein G5I_04873 [Acromyrmex echinatior]|uniref:Uncharacterized protein n=1 Tax=Acromyrmex echinatior TaxID=103372 RepID=F4WGS3_ACREC|nr:hypothetical protein G5I_04873 [Acromyrmex echinatior]
MQENAHELDERARREKCKTEAVKMKCETSINEITQRVCRNRLPPPSRSPTAEHNRKSGTHRVNQPKRTSTERVAKEGARLVDGSQATPISQRNESDDERIDGESSDKQK